MLTLARLLFVKNICTAAFLLSCTVPCFASELQPLDLGNPKKVISALGKKLSNADARSLQAFVAEARQADDAKRYGPAAKAWGAASLIQPTSGNLANLAEANLRETGMVTDSNLANRRRLTALPATVKLYESAFAAERVKPVLGKMTPQIVAHHACLKKYIDRKTISPNCEPLIWSGVIK